jgi:small conductance mechanosensitive channel
MNFQEIIQTVIAWLGTNGLRIILVFLGAWIINKIVGMSIERLIRKMVKPDFYATSEAEKKREDTLIRVFSGAFSVILYLMVIMMVLSELGINIGPLIAGAGVAGLAFGFGAQYLIRDIITGLFIIMENQYRVGDVVCLDGTCGCVEDINLRMTVLRDLDGTVHHIPNGAITKSSNLSKDFARVNLNIGISYNSDIEKVIDVVNHVGKELADDPKYKDMIKKPMEFLRVNAFGDSAVEIKILGDVIPLKQWEVAGEFRKRLKKAFDAASIEIPFPQRVVHMTKE